MFVCICKAVKESAVRVAAAEHPHLTARQALRICQAQKDGCPRYVNCCRWAEKIIRNEKEKRPQ